MSQDSNLHEKKLRGSGGYVFAKITEEEQKRGNLGGPDLFLAGVGRIDEDKFAKYYCNKCEKEYEGSPSIKYENPNEEIGEGVTLIEKGEYMCNICNSTIAQYRKFDTPSSASDSSSSLPSHSMANSSYSINMTDSSAKSVTAQSTKAGKNEKSSGISDTRTNLPIDKKESIPESPKEEGFIPIQTLIGMPAYDSDALLVGNVQEIGLHKSEAGKMQISLRIIKEYGSSDNSSNYTDSSSRQLIEVFWNNISKIGDIILLSNKAKEPDTNRDSLDSSVTSTSSECPSCNYRNEADAVFCESCGTKLV
jgi:sporulation protein YlmC with PRC-barrel domain